MEEEGEGLAGAISNPVITESENELILQKFRQKTCRLHVSLSLSRSPRRAGIMEDDS